MIKQAIILAGGFGTRLQSVVSDVPKPMADIGGGMPFLAFLIDYLKYFGVNKIVISAHHLNQKITNFFGEKYHEIGISYAVEDEPLGTGGAILNSLTEIDNSGDVLVLNGDSFLQIDYYELYKLHKKNRADLSIALRKMDDCSRYGSVLIDSDCRVTEFREKSTRIKNGLINGGIYIINPKIFKKMMLPKKFSFEQDFLMKNLYDFNVSGFVCEDYFIDIGVPEDYFRAKDELPKIYKILKSQNSDEYRNKALFLDRDGVINKDFGYVYQKEEFEFIDGIFDLCKKAQDKEYKIIIITNQSGIARGYYSEDEFLRLTKWVENEFLKRGIKIEKTFYSPYHEDGKVDKFVKYSFQRKPNPGMIIDAVEEFKIDVSKSIMIGDKKTDMLAAKAAKIGKRILVSEKIDLKSIDLEFE